MAEKSNYSVPLFSKTVILQTALCTNFAPSTKGTIAAASASAIANSEGFNALSENTLAKGGT